MRILVSGGNGYVSSCLRKYRSTNDTTFQFVSSSGKAFNTLEFNDFLTSKIETFFDVYIHAASIPRGCSVNRDRDNFKLLSMALEACRKNEIKKFIYLSSGAVYKNRNSCNSELEPVIENYAHNSSYAYYKVLGENLVKDFCDKNNMDYLILRLFSFGGSELINRCEFAIAQMINAANKIGVITVKQPKVVRSYLHSSDLARQIQAAITEANKTYNIGSGLSISMYELGKLIKLTVENTRKKNVQLNIVNDPSRDIYVPNVDRINSICDHAINVNLADVVRDMMIG